MIDYAGDGTGREELHVQRERLAGEREVSGIHAAQRRHRVKRAHRHVARRNHVKLIASIAAGGRREDAVVGGQSDLHIGHGLAARRRNPSHHRAAGDQSKILHDDLVNDAIRLRVRGGVAKGVISVQRHGRPRRHVEEGKASARVGGRVARQIIRAVQTDTQVHHHCPALTPQYPRNSSRIRHNYDSRGSLAGDYGRADRGGQGGTLRDRRGGDESISVGGEAADLERAVGSYVQADRADQCPATDLHRALTYHDVIMPAHGSYQDAGVGKDHVAGGYQQAGRELARISGRQSAGQRMDADERKVFRRHGDGAAEAVDETGEAELPGSVGIERISASEQTISAMEPHRGVGDDIAAITGQGASIDCPGQHRQRGQETYSAGGHVEILHLRLFLRGHAGDGFRRNLQEPFGGSPRRVAPGLLGAEVHEGHSAAGGNRHIHPLLLQPAKAVGEIGCKLGRRRQQVRIGSFKQIRHRRQGAGIQERVAVRIIVYHHPMIARRRIGQVQRVVAAGGADDPRFAREQETVLYFVDEAEMRRQPDRGRDRSAGRIVQELEIADKVTVARHEHFSRHVQPAQIVLADGELASVFLRGGHRRTSETVGDAANDQIQQEAAAIGHEVAAIHLAGAAVLDGTVLAELVSEIIGVIERGRGGDGDKFGRDMDVRRDDGGIGRHHRLRGAIILRLTHLSAGGCRERPDGDATY